jgi:AcrR family transcriptional regulator
MDQKLKIKVPKNSKSTKESYHHGNLYETLIQTAENLLRSKGLEAFSLRACAKEAGVAHSAPGHYFKDVSEILTEIGSRAFERLSLRLRTQLSKFPDEDPIYVVSSEYIKFAIDEPKFFQLIFHSKRIDRSTIRFQQTGDLALRELILAIDPDLTKRKMNTEKIRFAWSLIHGIAMLSIDGPMAPVGGKRSGLEFESTKGNIVKLVEIIRNWK